MADSEESDESTCCGDGSGDRCDGGCCDGGCDGDARESPRKLASSLSKDTSASPERLRCNVRSPGFFSTLYLSRRSPWNGGSHARRLADVRRSSFVAAIILDYISRHEVFIFIRISKRETHRFRWERLGCDSARGVDNKSCCLLGVSRSHGINNLPSLSHSQHQALRSKNQVHIFVILISSRFEKALF